MHITPPDHAKDICLLLARIILVTAFIVSARNKSRNPKKFAKNNGLPLPVAAVVMCVEFISGLAILLGFYAQFAAIALMLLMLGTIRLHVFKWKSPYWAASGGWEYDLMLFTLAFVIFVFGPGNIAIS
jgi:putative oxidoreductase